jgi:hypothetical protein
MKKLLAVLFLAVVLAGSLSALDWKSYPGGIQPGSWLINAGIGVGSPLYGSIVVPPLTVTLDYALPIGGIPFSVGGMFGFTASKYNGIGFSQGYSYFAFGGRFAYHPNFEVPNLDTYAVLTLGYYYYSWKYSNNYGPSSNSGSFLWGGAIGARYFFTNNVGIFAELGYTAFSVVTAGVTFKF